MTGRLNGGRHIGQPLNLACHLLRFQLCPPNALGRVCHGGRDISQRALLVQHRRGLYGHRVRHIGATGLTRSRLGTVGQENLAHALPGIQIQGRHGHLQRHALGRQGRHGNGHALPHLDQADGTSRHASLWPAHITPQVHFQPGCPIRQPRHLWVRQVHHQGVGLALGVFVAIGHLQGPYAVCCLVQRHGQIGRHALQAGRHFHNRQPRRFVSRRGFRDRHRDREGGLPRQPSPQLRQQGPFLRLTQPIGRHHPLCHEPR